MSDFNKLLERLRAQGIKSQPVVSTKKKRPTSKPANVNYINAKHHDSVQSMIHDVMFRHNGKIKANQLKIVGPMYEQFSETGKLTPKQTSYIAGLWTQIK